MKKHIELKLKNKLFEELLKFTSVGGVITVVSIAVYYLLLDLLRLPLYPVYISVYCVAVVFSYLLNAKYTFNKIINLTDALKYGITYIAGLLIGIVLIYIIQKYTSFSNFLSVLISIPARVLFTFVLVKLSIFKSQV